MIDSAILRILNEKFDNRYDYLRLGFVKVSVEERKATVTFLVPEDVYDYSLKKEDIENIKSSVTEALGGGFSVFCKFEKIVLTEESVKSSLVEYMNKNFPLIIANIDFSRVKAEIGDEVNLHFVVPKNIRDYMQSVDFDKKIKAFLMEKLAVKAVISYEISEEYVPENRTDRSTRSGRYGKTVEVSDKRAVYGKLSDLHGPAMHISTLKGEGEDVLCCGKINYLSFKTRDESKKDTYKRFFKHYYTFSISDTTGFLNVFINTDEAIPALENGKDVVCRGRVSTREDAMNFSMYAKAVALCEVPYALIAEQTKPLDPPAEYSVLKPTPYEEVTYDQIGFDFYRTSNSRIVKTDACVTVSLKSLRNERVLVPYEIAMCRVEGGKITEYIHTFLKVAFSEVSEKANYANQKGYASPRLSTVIPDLIKFSAGHLLVGLNPAAALDLLNATAKPLRYLFKNEIHIIQSSSLKKEDLRDDGALSEAVALAHAFLKE